MDGVGQPEGVRRRTKVDSNGVEKKDGATSMVRSRTSRSRSSVLRWVAVLGVVTATLMFTTLALGRFPWEGRTHAITSWDRLALKMGLQKSLYAIMFDAGSTGSRILVFSFHRVLADGSLKLDKEYFEEIKPGLSYYASNPSQAADSLRPLLEKAKSEIPQEYWAKTPLVLKATAGLRLLPGHKAESILSEVRSVFKASPFHVKDSSVSIMEGRDEGLFSWFTVNFLLDKLSDIDTTVASLDMGGGSTQVTFVAEEATLSSAPADHIHTVTVFNQAVKLYIHSYLGLGLMAARLDIFKTGNTSNNTPGNKEFHSPCIHTIVKETWNYAGKTYIIRGKEVPDIKTPADKKKVPRFEECFKVASKVVNSKVYLPKELEQQQVYAMSYYYDRAAESGLIDPFEGGQVNVDKYIDVSKAACRHPNTDQPFACLDLTYISALLSQGLGFKNKKPIILQKKIKNHEISWALGAAFHVLANEDIMP